MALCHRCQAIEIDLQEQHIAALQVDPTQPLVSIEQAAKQLGVDAWSVRAWLRAHRVPGLGPPVYRKRPRFPRTLSRVLRPDDVRQIGAYALRRLRTHHLGQATAWPGDTDGRDTAAARARNYRRARAGGWKSGQAPTKGSLALSATDVEPESPTVAPDETPA